MTGALLCVSPRCRVPGRHGESCPGGECRGCLPAWAQDGLRLCPRCTDHLGRDAVEVARLWRELGDRLVASGATGTVYAPNPHPGVALNLAAFELRREIVHVLAAWTGFVAEERGMAVPTNLAPANLAAFVARSATWLAATELAADAAVELADLRGRAWGAAYPEPVSIVDLGSCPEPECPGVLQARLRPADSALPSKVVCTVDAAHEWPTARWQALGRSLGRVWDEAVAPETVAAAYGIDVPAVYRRASRCGWRTVRQGRRVLYASADVMQSFGA